MKKAAWSWSDVVKTKKSTIKKCTINVADHDPIDKVEIEESPVSPFIISKSADLAATTIALDASETSKPEDQGQEREPGQSFEEGAQVENVPAVAAEEAAITDHGKKSAPLPQNHEGDAVGDAADQQLTMRAQNAPTAEPPTAEPPTAKKRDKPTQDARARSRSGSRRETLSMWSSVASAVTKATDGAMRPAVAETQHNTAHSAPHDQTPGRRSGHASSSRHEVQPAQSPGILKSGILKSGIPEPGIPEPGILDDPRGDMKKRTIIDDPFGGTF